MSLSSFLDRFRYTSLNKEATSSNNDDASGPGRMSLQSAWSSKRWRVVFLAGLIVLLIGAASYFRDHLVLPDYPSITGGGSGGDGGSLAVPFTGQLVSSNHDILEAVAPSIDWHRFSYIQYVTNVPYLCNSVMLFAILDRLNCRPDRLMMYPEQWKVDTNPGDDVPPETRLLRIARDKYKVKLQPIHVQSKGGSDPTWAESFTKLLAWNQTQYDRVLGLDSDSTVLKCMDELFLMPSAPIAMPRAYWIWKDHDELSSQLILIEPNATEFDRVMRITNDAGRGKYDMDILNDMYLASATIIPHRDYDLLTGEFKNKGPKDHAMYLGSDEAYWDAKTELARAKFLHFSDWPIPKPWLVAGQSTLDQNGPKCTAEGDCTEKDLWYGFYSDFKTRRKEVCDM